MAAGGVEFADVSFALHGERSSARTLLHGVSFGVAPGTTTALLGRSGSGKTTLLRTVNALVRPSGGRVLVQGSDIAQADVTALRRSIGYVIQETGLFPHMTIGRNVGMALELARRPQDEIAGRVAEMLTLVGLDEDFAARMPWQLSGGQRQRAGLARALAAKPEVLLLDEPFGALDPLTRVELQTTLKELLARTGVTALIVTHDLAEALFLADQIVFLEAGRVEAVLAANETEASDNEAVRKYIAATRPRDASRVGGAA
jgi:osmoprotectant transport system ATP-binding protein